MASAEIVHQLKKRFVPYSAAQLVKHEDALAGSRLVPVTFADNRLGLVKRLLLARPGALREFRSRRKEHGSHLFAVGRFQDAFVLSLEALLRGNDSLVVGKRRRQPRVGIGLG